MAKWNSKQYENISGDTFTDNYPSIVAKREPQSTSNYAHKVLLALNIGLYKIFSWIPKIISFEKCISIGSNR